MSDPRKHHYIPQWQMRLWCHEKDQVNAIILRDTPRIKAITTNVKNLNVKRDLYSLKPKGDDVVDVRLETELYSPLDDDACIFTREIISILDSGKIPNLNDSQRSFLWGFYVYDAYKRHPGLVQRHLDNWDKTEFKKNAIQSLIDEGKKPFEAVKMFEGVEYNKTVNDTIVQNVRITNPGGPMAQFLKAEIVLYIAPEGSSFVLPDRTYEVGEERRSPLQGIYIPIHPRYAIMPARQNENIGIFHLDKSGVRRLNEHWYSISNTVISTSQRLLISLAKNVGRKKVTFN